MRRARFALPRRPTRGPSRSYNSEVSPMISGRPLWHFLARMQRAAVLAQGQQQTTPPPRSTPVPHPFPGSSRRRPRRRANHRTRAPTRRVSPDRPVVPPAQGAGRRASLSGGGVCARSTRTRPALLPVRHEHIVPEIIKYYRTSSAAAAASCSARRPCSSSISAASTRTRWPFRRASSSRTTRGTARRAISSSRAPRKSATERSSRSSQRLRADQAFTLQLTSRPLDRRPDRSDPLTIQTSDLDE